MCNLRLPSIFPPRQGKFLLTPGFPWEAPEWMCCFRKLQQVWEGRESPTPLVLWRKTQLFP